MNQEHVMQVIRAEAMGLCFGVRDALAAAEQVERPDRVTIHGELVHNETVLGRLRERGFRQADEACRDGLPATPLVMITAHGVSDAERRRLADAGLSLLDTTCPLVRRVHLAAQKLAAEGRFVLLIGRPGHVEVRGIVEDLAEVEVVDNVAAVRRYPHARLGVICQSTTSPHLADEILAAIDAANPAADIEFVDTICQPTRDRQTAVARMLPLVDAVVVVGGKNSNNTRELANLCRASGKPVYHVQSAGDLDRAWFTDCTAVGLTAGTSTLDETIDNVHRALAAIGSDESV
jgi:4-hydroxy-3-methylbut-2-en-1-yl diphosphate reductase